MLEIQIQIEQIKNMIFQKNLLDERKHERFKKLVLKSQLPRITCNYI